MIKTSASGSKTLTILQLITSALALAGSIYGSVLVFRILGDCSGLNCAISILPGSIAFFSLIVFSFVVWIMIRPFKNPEKK